MRISINKIASHTCAIVLLWAVSLAQPALAQAPQLMDIHAKAATHFAADKQWYINNIPFFECADKQLEQVYYYRWKMYKAHIRNVGDKGPVVTEFINDVSWDRNPYSTINAASMHHIYEGRWLRDQSIMQGYINNLYQYGGNNRAYSESVADAAFAYYQVQQDAGFVASHLDSMMSIYNAWQDHYDSSRQLYYIAAMPDATEYNVAAIDASGGKDGFEGGEAFRPTINSYMYGNALGIAKIAALKGNTKVAAAYQEKAKQLKKLIQTHLWNDSLKHFMDRYKVQNQFVRNWDFIRSRELAGMAPWYFNLPEDDGNYSKSWKQLTDTSRLLGKYGMRTNEPSYPYYFVQFLYHEGKRGSQWNGPSWPFQTSIALTGMANLLQHYQQHQVKVADYLHLLRQYAKQHFLPDGSINLVENYDPNLGEPIVHYYWSNHYNHSSFNNLILSGLCGIIPSEGDTLALQPLVDTSVPFFAVNNLRYHGRNLAVVYDATGEKYKIGKGLHLWIDGKKVLLARCNKQYVTYIAPAVKKRIATATPENYALNITRDSLQQPVASINNHPDSLYQAVDGRVWYFPEITNYWTTRGSLNKSDWFQVSFAMPRNIRTIKLYFVVNAADIDLPTEVSIRYRVNNLWYDYKKISTKFTANTVSNISCQINNATAIKIHFIHPKKQVALSEMECY